MNIHILMIVIVAIMAIAGIVSVKYFGDNNPIEKAVEAVIKDETGLSVNLDSSAPSPSSPSNAPLSQTGQGTPQGTQAPSPSANPTTNAH